MKPEELGAYYESILDKELRKESGVYYTPQYIVDYIVEHTLGKLLQGKTPEESARIKIVDPACGAGMFLLGAYQYLINWHEKHSGKLTLAKRRKMLTDNIFGVDIDPLAVDITKYCLSMMCSGNKDFTLDLDGNIRVGNSLVDTNFYDYSFDESVERTVKPLNWQRAFPQVFQQGGFDVVIGNPPYVNLAALPEIQRHYFQTKYETCKNKCDLYSFFLERTCRLVHPTTGHFGFIIPCTWLATDSFKPIRQKLLNEHKIREIVELGHNVFKQVTVSTVILVGSTNQNEKIIVKNHDFTERFIVPVKKWTRKDFHIDLHWNPVDEKLFHKIESNTVPLGQILQFSRGLKTSDDKRFILKTKKNKDCKPVFRGRNIKAYTFDWAKEYVWYRPDLIKEKAGCLPHSKEFFEPPEKLVMQRISKRIQVAYDNEQNYFLDTVNVSDMKTWDKKHSLKYIMALLNSKLLNYWYCKKYKMPTIGLYEIHAIPFRTIDFDNAAELDMYQQIIRQVDQLLNDSSGIRLQYHLIEDKIAHFEKRIDELVYQLYDLTDEEIAIVENA